MSRLRVSFMWCVLQFVLQDWPCCYLDLQRDLTLRFFQYLSVLFCFDCAFRQIFEIHRSKQVVILKKSVLRCGLLDSSAEAAMFFWTLKFLLICYMFSVALPNSRSCDLSKFHFCSLLAAFVLVASAKMTTRCQCLFDETGTLLAFTCHAFLLPKCIGREPNSSKSQYLKKFLIIATKSPVSTTRDRL